MSVHAAPAWRLITDDAQDGAWNMAVDEALLEACEAQGEASAPTPTLRLYAWRPAALSIGKTQPVAGSHDAEVLRAEGVDLVRRPTGGEAVLHEHERTYAIVGVPGLPPFPGGPMDTYRRIGEALVRGLARLGVDACAVQPSGMPRRPHGVVCFERVGAWEIATSGRKLIGSSQFRRRRAFLQHGSIPIRLDARRLAAMIGVPVDASRFVDLATAAGRPIGLTELDRALVAGIEDVFGARVAPGHLTELEALRAAELRCWKYDSLAWTVSGRIGERERRWGPAPAR